MQCVICKGKKVITKEDQTEICENCFGSGVIETKKGE